MPFTSKRQMRAAFGGHIPGISKEKAREWAHETPNLKDLPDRAPAERGKPTLRSKESQLAHAHDSGEDLNEASIRRGRKVEMEHTKNPATARQIAIDHLRELPDYYERLERAEKTAALSHAFVTLRLHGHKVAEDSALERRRDLIDAAGLATLGVPAALGTLGWAGEAMHVPGAKHLSHLAEHKGLERATELAGLSLVAPHVTRFLANRMHPTSPPITPAVGQQAAPPMLEAVKEANLPQPMLNAIEHQAPGIAAHITNNLEKAKNAILPFEHVMPMHGGHAPLPPRQQVFRPGHGPTPVLPESAIHSIPSAPHATVTPKGPPPVPTTAPPVPTTAPPAPGATPAKTRFPGWLPYAAGTLGVAGTAAGGYGLLRAANGASHALTGHEAGPMSIPTVAPQQGVVPAY